MTLKLLLIRHAKSSWGDPSMSDRQRPLNDRGQAAAPRIGRWIKAQDAVPDLVVSSDATRTRQTMSLLMSEWDSPVVTKLEPRLYLADPSTLLAVLRAQTAKTVAFIGHNPGIAMFASEMVFSAPEHPSFYNYPTCATTVLSFKAATWSDVRPSMGTVDGFAIPRELP